MDVENIQKINSLALSLMKQGLATDREDAVKQAERAYHFGEWFVAMDFAKQGYKVLVEKYRSHRTHKRKYDVLFRYFSPEEIDFLTKSKHQPPDLFVYKGRDKFFVEVKRDSDSLSISQKKFFGEIERRMNCRVRIVHLRGGQ